MDSGEAVARCPVVGLAMAFRPAPGPLWPGAGSVSNSPLLTTSLPMLGGDSGLEPEAAGSVGAAPCMITIVCCRKNESVTPRYVQATILARAFSVDREDLP